MNDPPPAPSEVVPELPGELDQVVQRAMAKAPAERFLSAGDLGVAALAAAEGREAAVCEAARREKGGCRESRGSNSTR